MHRLQFGGALRARRGHCFHESTRQHSSESQMIQSTKNTNACNAFLLEGLPPGCGHRGGGLGDLACNTVEDVAAEFPLLGTVEKIPENTLKIRENLLRPNLSMIQFVDSKSISVLPCCCLGAEIAAALSFTKLDGR